MITGTSPFKKRDMNCVLCNEDIKGNYGHNPAPLSDEGDCCDECNMTKVIPARIGAVVKIYQEADKNGTNPLKNFKD
tara:strand:- start:392 stop:622 length:231 start_codon:yes stop_codon:yes gene_type:complete